MTAEYERRLPKLGNEVGVPLSMDDCADAWKLRCDLVHSASFLATAQTITVPDRQIVLYDKLEDTLRKAVLRSVRDANFAAIFQDTDLIKSRWPI